MAKVYFDLDYSACQRLEQAIKNYAGNAESAINEYLGEKGNENLISKTTSYIPVSVNPSEARGNKHAKDSIWYDVENPNLGIALSNSIKGTRKTSFYYLYYVATGTGTSAPEKKDAGVGGEDFFTDGGNKASPIIQQELLDLLVEKLEGEIK